MTTRHSASFTVALLVTLSAAAAAAPLKRFAIIGDSISAGTGVSDVRRVTSNQLSAQANVIVHNMASPGQTMANIFLPGMNTIGPGMGRLSGFGGMQGIIIILGTNDWGQSVAAQTFLDAYGHLLDTLPPVPVVCVTPTWRSNEGAVNAQGYTLDTYRFLAAAACVIRNKPWLDGKSAIPNDLAHFPDGLHPNDIGHDALTTFLKTQLTAMGWLP